MKTNSYSHMLLLTLISFALLSCRKEDRFLSAKPDQQLFLPATLSDLAGLMHNENLFNNTDPGLGEIASDDFYVTAAVLQARSTTIERNGYIWAKQVYDAGQDVSDWTIPYQQVYYCNTVLEKLPGIPASDGQQATADEIRGDALFFRGRAFYNLLQTFALPYDAQTAAGTAGVPLRLNSDINIRSPRASVQQGYEQVLADLKASVSLLPVKPAYITQPSRPAASGLLSRVYLTMGDYQQALYYASQALNDFPALTDYNKLVPQSRSISTNYISEDIFHCVLNIYSIFSVNSVSIADTTLYGSYAANDLRKTAFFILKTGLPYFRGTYDYRRLPYSGIATDELYLNKAECEARLGNVAAALADLNTLLASRWKKGTFVPFEASSAEQALKLILTERRKELLYRGLRWTDLRRLNKESATATTLTRLVDGTTYTLPPNDARYAWPIPDNEIAQNPITQNQR